MKIEYDQEVDALYIQFKNSEIVNSDEEPEGFVFDYDADGNIVGLEIRNASKQVDNPIEFLRAG